MNVLIILGDIRKLSMGGVIVKHKKNCIILISLLCIIPTIVMILFMVSMSFMSGSQIEQYYGVIDTGNNMMQFASLKLFPTDWSFEQYRSILYDNSDFWFYFWNSISYTLPSVIIGCIVSVCGGYAFAKFRFPLKKFWLVIFIVIMMIPYQVLIPATLNFYKNLSFLNNRVTVILPNIFTGFGTYLLYKFFECVPDEQIEAAKLDGCNSFIILIRIILPQCKNAICAYIILSTIDFWNLVEQPIAYLTDKFKYPVSAAFTEFSKQGIGQQAASSIVFIIPLLILFILYKDNLIEGIEKSVVGSSKR